MTSPTSPTNRITTPITGPLTVPERPKAMAPASRSVRRRRATRVPVVAAALALLVGILLCALTLPARAATTGNPGAGSGVGTPQHPAASGHQDGTSGELAFGALCVVGILATAGGVLWYTIRTRRTLD